MRSFSRSTSRTITSSSWPTLSISLGCFTRPQLMSVMCRRPSMPSRSMNAPKSVMFFTLPLRTSPFCSEASSSARFSAIVPSMSSRRLTMMFLRSHLRTGEERLHAVDVHEQAAMHLRLDRAGDHAPFGVLRQDLLPADLDVGGLLGKGHHARLVVLKLAHEHLDLLAGLRGRGIGELGQVDLAFALVADVDEYVVALHDLDCAVDDLSGLDRLGLPHAACQQLRHRLGLLGGQGWFTDCHLLLFVVCL